MTWVDILVLAVLFFSFIGGLKGGAVKSLFSLLALIFAIPLAGIYYYIVATLLAFLPGSNWENFIGFFITLALISAMLHLVFLIPRRIAEKVWEEGVFFRLLGGGMSVLNAGTGMVLFTLVVGVYPIIGWLEGVVADSSALAWLAAHLTFVAAMLPGVFPKAASFVGAL